MGTLTLLLGLSVLAYAQASYAKPRYVGYRYNGRFQGKCQEDGFYYKDSSHFVVCFNYYAYHLPCGQGAQNSPDERYVKGQPYAYRDFCDVHVDKRPEEGYGDDSRSEEKDDKDKYQGYGYKPEKKQEGYGYKPEKKQEGYGYKPKKKEEGYGYKPEKKEEKKEKKKEVKKYQPIIYNGYYPGKCHDDGFYYLDSSSFVVCSNKQAFILPCAPGSKNSVFRKYVKGDGYAYRDFCDVNLVDEGYTAKHAAQAKKSSEYKGYGGDSQEETGYGKSSKGYGKSPEGYGKSSEGYGKSSEGSDSSETYGKSQEKYSESQEGYGKSQEGYGKIHQTYSKSDEKYPKPPKYHPGYYRYDPYGYYGYYMPYPPPRPAAGYGKPHKGDKKQEGYGKQDDKKSTYDTHEGYEDSKEDKKDEYHQGYGSETTRNSFTYRGRFQDKCPQDGFYYFDSYSFVICSNDHPFKLPCSPGTQNSPFTAFTEGSEYHYRDFCDVNLVAQGYGTKPKKEDKKDEHKTYKPKTEEKKTDVYPPKKKVYEKHPTKPSKENKDKFTFNGFFGGRCGKDGFYYRNLYSFVACLNGVPHHLPCAPGSSNKPYTTFITGSPYSYRHFCDVNLVARGAHMRTPPHGKRH